MSEPRKTVYFDHNATTPVDPRVLNAMLPYFTEHFGNASCLYSYGVDASYAVEKARLRLARLIGSSPEEIVFTSGGAEADNMALKGAFLATGKRRVVTTAIEHPAVLRTCQFMESYMGCEVVYLPVDREGRVDPRDVEAAITNDTALVSVMTANNEIGAIEPIAEIANAVKRRGALFHTDAVQAVGKIPIHVDELGVDMLSISAHKFYGPKGVGALYVRNGTPLLSLIQGGNHESGLRAGTENVTGIVGLGEAAVIASKETVKQADSVERMRERLWNRVVDLDMEIVRNSPARDALPGVLNISLPGIDARELIRAMDEEGFCVAAGSACSTGNPTPSYVLRAIGLPEQIAAASIRISLGTGNTMEEIDRFVDALPQVAERVAIDMTAS